MSMGIKREHKDTKGNTEKILTIYIYPRGLKMRKLRVGRGHIHTTSLHDLGHIDRLHKRDLQLHDNERNDDPGKNLNIVKIIVTVLLFR